MRKRVTIKEVFSVVKLSLFPIWGWPLPQNATKLRIFCVKLYYCLNMILEICMTVSLIHSKPINDILKLLIRGSLNIFFFVISNFIFLIANYHRIQNATFEMIHFCDLMKPHEEVVIQRYVDKCIMFHGIFIFIQYFFVFADTAMAIPSLTHKSFQTIRLYSFDVSYQLLLTIIFIVDSIMELMVTSLECITVYIALLLWFASARFEILTKELRKVKDVRQLLKYIKKHQELYNYAREIIITVRPFVYINFIGGMFTIISDILYVLLLKNQLSFARVSMSFLGVILELLTVLVFVWPAEHLMYTSKDVAQAAFDILENKNLTEIWKYLQIIIMRSQKPITVSIPFFLPELSANYLTSYLSTILSYLAALRVIMNNVSTQI